MSPITYTRQGDYRFPNIVLNNNHIQSEPLTKYALMRRSFLKEHKPILYSQLLLNGRLTSHLLDTQLAADIRQETLMVQLTKRFPPPSKEKDQMAWTAHMNNLLHSAEEIVLKEIIYE